MAGELSYLVESDLGVVIPLTNFFDGSSLADLTGLILAEVGREKPSPAVAQPPVSEFPLSVGQQALWSLYQMAPESAAYNIAYAMRLRLPLDVPTLQRALQALVQRHPALRVTITVRNGEPLQRVAFAAELALQQEDAAGWSESASASGWRKKPIARSTSSAGRCCGWRSFAFRRKNTSFCWSSTTSSPISGRWPG